MTQILTTEQFEYQKTLADIGVGIAKGRAEMADLKSQKEDFLLKQEAEAVKRVEAALAASEDALNQATLNQHLLEDWHKEVQSFALEVLSWKEKLSTQQQDFEERSAKAWAEIKQKTAQLEQTAQDQKIQFDVIKANRKQHDQERLALNDKERAINDKYATLLRSQKYVR